MSHTSRRRFLTVAGLAALAGCSSSAGDSGGNDPTTGSSPTDGSTDSSASTPTGDEIPAADRRLPLPMSPEELRQNAQSGGPAKDGIPSIDSPKFIDADAVDYLEPGDPVFGVVRDDVVKAYPQKILVWHEIVNDDLAGSPVSVTYCPLTGTVQGFERGSATFGVSGRLINNNLVMYDRATEAWWPQILATSIAGPWNEDAASRSLREFRLVWTSWDRWQTLHPETSVLSLDTGHAMNYNRDPYGSYNPSGGYYEGGKPMFPALGSDDRYQDKTVVMGARLPEGAVAFLKDAIRDQGVMTGDLGDLPVVCVYDHRLDTAYVYRNPDEETFEFDDGSIVAADGTANGPDDLPLDRIHTFDAMWFAWSGYYPDTTVYE